MKGKLNRRDGDYWLHNESGETIASSWGVYGRKLSTKNCDEIFGVVDVEKLTKDSYQKHSVHDDKLSLDEQIQRSGGFIVGFKEGFIKAMELNKDKVFTLEDMKTVWDRSVDYRHNPIHENSFGECINFLQKPPAIEVEIETELNLKGKNAIDRSMYIPKLDENGCLILTKKISQTLN